MNHFLLLLLVGLAIYFRTGDRPTTFTPGLRELSSGSEEPVSEAERSRRLE